MDPLPPSLRPQFRSPQPRAAGPKDRVWLNVFLFVATFLSSTFAYTAFQSSAEDLKGSLQTGSLDPWLPGLMFAGTLMAILLAHEMGHYLTAKKLGVDQSMPFFIPLPFTILGTLGAVIVMRSQPRSRHDLLRVAVNGPYWGMVLAIPAAAWGLAMSTPVPADLNLEGGLWFGSSLLFGALEALFSPNGTDVFLHPVGFAGWVGMFVTCLNLIPAGQLDGGHISYALFGRKHHLISRAVVVILAGIGAACALSAQPDAWFWPALMLASVTHAALRPTVPGSKWAVLFVMILAMFNGPSTGFLWNFWATLLLFVGLHHPPVQNESEALRPRARLNGVFAMLVFAVTFIPNPIEIIEPEDTGIDIEQPGDAFDTDEEEFEL